MKRLSEAENASIVAEVEALRGMTVAQLRPKWQEVFGERPRTSNKQHLWRRLAWQIQANAYGGLSDRAKKRIDELIPEAVQWWESRKTSKDVEKPAPRKQPSAHDPRLPKPGTILTRDYKGQRIEVEVLEDGFAYDGKTYRSLSAVARDVTGSHWNGFLFFGIAGKGKRS